MARQGNVRILVRLALAGASLQAGVLGGEPVIQTDERLQLDWASMTLRFFGESAPGKDFVDAEKEAWSEGLRYSEAAVARLHESEHQALSLPEEVIKKSASEAGRRIASSTYSRNTIYYADGRVSVELENSLPRAMAPTVVEFATKDAPPLDGARNTGIILRFAKGESVKPRAVYRIVSEDGNVMFGLSSIAEKAFEKNLMGRWFRNAQAQELKPAVGDNPAVIENIREVRPGVFQVPAAEWVRAVDGNSSVLSNVRIALVLQR